jgi:hypothetical protein
LTIRSRSRQTSALVPVVVEAHMLHEGVRRFLTTVPRALLLLPQRRSRTCKSIRRRRVKTDSRDPLPLSLLYRFDYSSWAWISDYEPRRKPLMKWLPELRRRSAALKGSRSTTLSRLVNPSAAHLSILIPITRLPTFVPHGLCISELWSGMISPLNPVAPEA